MSAYMTLLHKTYRQLMDDVLAAVEAKKDQDTIYDLMSDFEDKLDLLSYDDTYADSTDSDLW